MQSFSAECIAAMAAGEVRVHAALKLVFDDTFKFWSGAGLLNFGDGDYLGVQSAALLPTMTSDLGGAAAGIQIGLSGIDPDLAATTLDESYRQKPAIMWRLFFNLDMTALLDAKVWRRGRVEDMPLEEVIGGASTISLMIEGASRDMQRRGARMVSDSDQRVLGGPLDGSCRRMGYAGKKINYWGQRKTEPAAAQTSYPIAPYF